MVDSLGLNMQALGVLATQVDNAADRVARSTAALAQTVPPQPEADRGFVLAVTDHSLPFGQPGPPLTQDSVFVEPPSRAVESLLLQGVGLDPARDQAAILRAEDAFQVGAAVTRTVEQTAGSVMNLWV